MCTPLCCMNPDPQSAFGGSSLFRWHRDRISNANSSMEWWDIALPHYEANGNNKPYQNITWRKLTRKFSAISGTSRYKVDKNVQESQKHLGMLGWVLPTDNPFRLYPLCWVDASQRWSGKVNPHYKPTGVPRHSISIRAGPGQLNVCFFQGLVTVNASCKILNDFKCISLHSLIVNDRKLLQKALPKDDVARQSPPASQPARMTIDV